MDKINPVVLILGLFTAAFGGTGLWAFAASFLTRKSDAKSKNSDALKSFEEASSRFREEIRAENTSLRKEIRDMKLVFIPLIDTLDEFLPKMVECLSTDERMLIRDRVNVAKLKT